MSIRSRINFILFFCSVFSASQAQENEIQSICDAFVQGRILLYAKGDLGLLDSVCNDKMDTIHLLYSEELEMLFQEGYSNQNFIFSNRAESVKAIEVINDSARCIMQGISLKEINLYKEGENWTVCGTNGTYASSLLIAEKRKKLQTRRLENENIKKSQPVLEKIDQFKRGLTQLLEDQSSSELSKCCSPEVIEFLNLFITYCIEKESLEVIERKRRSYKSWIGYTSFQESRANCSINNEEDRVFQLERSTNDEWTIIGFNGYQGKQLNEECMIVHYDSFMRVFGLYERP